MDPRIHFLLGSARAGGNTERLARVAAASLPAGAESRWLRLADLQLEPFADDMGMRFAGAVVGHGNRPGDVERDEAALAAARRLLAG